MFKSYWDWFGSKYGQAKHSHRIRNSDSSIVQLYDHLLKLLYFLSLITFHTWVCFSVFQTWLFFGWFCRISITSAALVNLHMKANLCSWIVTVHFIEDIFLLFRLLRSFFFGCHASKNPQRASVKLLYWAVADSSIRSGRQLGVQLEMSHNRGN